MKKIAWLVFTILFLISCSTKPQNVVPQTPITLQDSPVPTNTAFSRPSITATISNTSHPVPTKTPTTTPDPILLTQEAEVSACAGSEKNWFDKFVWNTYFINGQWNAYVCKDNGIYTKISNSTLGTVWTIPAVSNEQTNSEPEWYWLPYLWSDNGKYLYLKPICLCSIDSPWLIYSSGYGLSRLDLGIGEFAVWLKPSDIGYSFEFSQGENLFAFSPYDLPDVIKIRNLIDGDEQDLSFKEKYAILEFRWTSDNSRLVILTEEHEADPSKSGFSVFVYSVKSEALTKLLDRNNLNFSLPTEDFIEPRVYISNLTDDVLILAIDYSQNEFQLNIRTGELVQVIETATPAQTP